MRFIDPASAPLDIHDDRRTKRCTNCEAVKSIAQFPWRKDRENYRSQCIDCVTLRERMRRQAKASGNWRDDRRFYTQEELATLRACIDAGMTSADTAKKIGRTRHSVSRARLNHHMPPFRKPSRALERRPQWSDDRLLTIAQCRVAGKSLSATGRACGVSRNAIGGAIHRYRPRIEELIAHEASQPMGDRSRDVLRLPVETRLERG